MFGALTRESFEWHPHRIICKRFGVRDPYPRVSFFAPTSLFCETFNDGLLIKACVLSANPLFPIQPIQPTQHNLIQSTHSCFFFFSSSSSSFFFFLFLTTRSPPLRRLLVAVWTRGTRDRGGCALNPPQSVQQVGTPNPTTTTAPTAAAAAAAVL